MVDCGLASQQANLISEIMPERKLTRHIFVCISFQVWDINYQTPSHKVEIIKYVKRTRSLHLIFPLVRREEVGVLLKGYQGADPSKFVIMALHL